MGNDSGEGLFERLEHEIQMYTMKESMEAKLNCNDLLSMTQMMVRKQKMKLYLSPSLLN